MTDDEYHRRRQHLLEVLRDAVDRGDYYLEMDVRERIDELQDQYYQENEE